METKKIYVVTEEYCNDSNTEYDVIAAFDDKEDAIARMQKQYESNMQMGHWANKKKGEDIQVDDQGDSIYVYDECDDYYFMLEVKTTFLHNK